MRAFGALDQMYRILGKTYGGSIDSDEFIAERVDYVSSGDVLIGLASTLRQGGVPFEVCWTVWSLSVMMSWAKLGPVWKPGVEGHRSFFSRSDPLSSIGCNCLILLISSSVRCWWPPGLCSHRRASFHTIAGYCGMFGWPFKRYACYCISIVRRHPTPNITVFSVGRK